jgi:hypothetical protein
MDDRGKSSRLGRLGRRAAPSHLRQRGVDIRVLMPAYQEVIGKLPHVDWIGDLRGSAGIPRARLGEVRLRTA